MANDNPLTFFIVENEVLMINMLTRILKATGHTVWSEVGAASAIAQIEAVKPDYILSDLNMEGKNGLEFCAKVRTIGTLRNTPIVVVSGEAAEIWEQRVLDAGADGFIQKPIDPLTFLDTVTGIMAGRRSRRPKAAPPR